MISALLTIKLLELKIFADEDFYHLSYDFFYTLAHVAERNFSSRHEQNFFRHD